MEGNSGDEKLLKRWKGELRSKGQRLIESRGYGIRGKAYRPLFANIEKIFFIMCTKLKKKMSLIRTCKINSASCQIYDHKILSLFTIVSENYINVG